MSPFSSRVVTRPIDPESRLFLINSSKEMAFIVVIPIISYSDRRILIFLSSYTSKLQLFPTSYPITENEFSHIDTRLLLMWEPNIHTGINGIAVSIQRFERVTYIIVRRVAAEREEVNRENCLPNLLNSSKTTADST